MFNRTFIILAIIVLCAGLAAAQEGVDPGDPDTVTVNSVQADAGQQAVVEVEFFNDEEIGSFSIPLTWSSPDITVDSVSFVGSRVEYVGTRPVTIDNSIQYVVFGAVVIFETPIQPGTGLMAKIYFDIPPGTPDQVVEIDSTRSGAAELLFSTPEGEGFTPQFNAATLIIGDPPIPPHIELTPDSMTFQGTIGFPDPPAQTLIIQNSGEGTLGWNSSSTASWLSASPSTGTATSYVSVRADIDGLTEGTYVDTLIITSAGADNSPQYMVAVLELTKLPPNIVFEPDEFFVSAVQGGANPSDRYLYIDTDVPGSELNWTVSSSSSWLSLSPTTGSPPDSVSLSFDITGLTFGTYQDTIVISDPDAENDPQYVPVTLQIVSDLPVLAFDPDTVYVVVPVGTQVDPATALIYNDGEGSMTYQASEGSILITGLSPSSGTAPQEMSISFKTFPLEQGDYLDSILVTSPEAVNSPRYLYVWLHVTDNPSRLALTKDSLYFTYYECWQGPNAVPQSQTFQVMNLGDEDMDWYLEYEPDWYTLSDTAGTNNTIISAMLNAEGLPLGTYYDTVTVYAPYALFSPKTLIVRLDVIPGDETPYLVYGADSAKLYAQEVFGPEVNPFNFKVIYNQYPGCMDFSFDEDIPWFTVIDSVGSAPEQVRASIDGNLIQYGVYYDSLFINSPEASNTPVKVNIELVVWRLHGDVNWDNTINMADVMYIIQYIFYGGAEPIPVFETGDTNCDNQVNMTDVVILLNWIFYGGDDPCGNP